MKRYLSIVLFLFTLLFIGCTDTNNKTGNVDSKKYFEDISYLVMYPGAEKVSFDAPEQEGGMSRGVYTIPDKDLGKATSKYAKILEDDGWEVKIDEANNFLDCRKEDHIAALIFSMKNEKPTLEILSK